MRQHRGTRALQSLAAALFMSALAVGSQAQITFHVGAGAIQPPENVLVDSHSGFNVFGHTNQSNAPVLITSDENITAQAQGQARAEAADLTGYQFLCIELDDPDLSFTELEWNLNVFKPARGHASGNVVFTVFDEDGNLIATSNAFAISSAGQNFFGIEAEGDTRISKVCYDTDVDVLDTRQMRLGGIGSDVVPEGSSMALLGTGLLPLAGVAMRRRRAAAQK